MEKRKMLVVDGDILQRQMLCGLFDGDFEILQAAEGEEALSLLRQQADSVSIVLLELIGLKPDGLDVLRAIGQEEALCHIPVIVTGASGEEGLWLKALALGAADYLPALFHPALARLRVENALAYREAQLLRQENEMLRARQEEATHTRLMQALTAAESASAAKGEFTSRMSHEIRIPLNAVIGFVNLARHSIGDDKRVDEYLSKTEFASRHLLSIVNDVLDMSAIETGQMTLNSESYNLRELVNAVTAMVYPAIHKKNIQFQILLESVTEEALIGDKLRLSQILLNLLSNAVKFTPQNGQVVLTVNQRKVAAHRIQMDFVVGDSGVGMSKEFLEGLGQPFRQEDTGVANRYGGSGLGLSITKKLIALMHGVMTVASSEGCGSTFTVSLPVDVEQAQPSDQAYSFAQVNALVIDGQESAGEHTRACFRSFGCRCDSASSGQAALALCQTNHYNLVLMDWKLPDLNGWCIIEAIRQAMDTEPAIFIMAYDYTEISKEVADGIGFVNKPIFQSSVLDLLLQLYGKYEVKPLAAPLPGFKGKRLLLAEDNALNSEIAVALLRGMGFAVTVVVDGREACDAFLHSEPGDYDGILMDVQMPLLDGYQATRRIRASRHPQAQSIPIIAMSADAFSQDVAAALDCGMNGHIAKPIDADSMSKTIAAHILNQRS